MLEMLKALDQQNTDGVFFDSSIPDGRLQSLGFSAALCLINDSLAQWEIDQTGGVHE
jgi:hypothetical protein